MIPLINNPYSAITALLNKSKGTEGNELYWITQKCTITF